MKNFLPLIASITAFIVLIGVYGFMYARVSDGVERAGVAASRTDSLSERDAIIRSQQIFLEDSFEARSKLEEFVTSESQVIEVIEIIEDTADERGVDLAISTVNTVDRGWQSHEGVLVDFSASGSFSRMMQFIGALESLPVASKLDRVALEVSGSGDWFGTFSVLFVKIK